MPVGGHGKGDDPRNGEELLCGGQFSLLGNGDLRLASHNDLVRRHRRTVYGDCSRNSRRPCDAIVKRSRVHFRAAIGLEWYERATDTFDFSSTFLRDAELGVGNDSARRRLLARYVLLARRVTCWGGPITCDT